MKIILAIFAIAFGAALVALWDNSDLSGVIGSVPALPASDAQVRLAAAERNDGEGSDAADVLRIASERLDRYGSVVALMRYRVGLFDSELIGSGVYQQTGQGSERRFRLELKTQLGDEIVGRLQVCDGKALWTYREKPGGAQLERLDLDRVRAAQRQAATLLPAAPVEELATGGLPRLLEGLRLNFRPLKGEAGYLGEAAMWAIELEWKPSVLAALAPEQQERINAGEPCDFADLPQLPQRVMVFLGQEDLFPRRIEFRRRDSGIAEQGRGEERSRDEFVAEVTLEFTDVQFNQPIDPRQFVYEPGQTGPNDVTDAFLQSRRLPIVR